MIMHAFIQEIVVDGPIYLILAFLSFLNIIVPLSGSSTQTPLIATLTGDAHYAITLSTWLLMISCAMISFVFRKDIRKDYLWKLLPSSILFAVIGAYLFIQLPNWLVILILFMSSVHFLYKILWNLFDKEKEKKKKKKNIISSRQLLEHYPDFYKVLVYLVLVSEQVICTQNA